VADRRRERIEGLFRRYGAGVGSYVLARVGNADLAEAITSNVFLIVVRQIDQCRSAPAAWLWSIVRTELARHFRQHRSTATLPESYPDRAPGPPEQAERREMQRRMWLALDRLDEEPHRIIYLKFFLDVPNTQIASQLGLSRSNIGVIVHRAIKQLRELMAQPEPGDGQPAAGQGVPAIEILIAAVAMSLGLYFSSGA